MKPLTERIENMLAELRGIVEQVNVSMFLSTPQDRAFIAKSRTITPLMASLLIGTIGTLRAIAFHGLTAAVERQVATDSLTELVTKWEAGKL